VLDSLCCFHACRRRPCGCPTPGGGAIFTRHGPADELDAIDEIKVEVVDESVLGISIAEESNQFHEQAVIPPESDDRSSTSRVVASTGESDRSSSPTHSGVSAGNKTAPPTTKGGAAFSISGATLMSARAREQLRNRGALSGAYSAAANIENQQARLEAERKQRDLQSHLSAAREARRRAMAAEQDLAMELMHAETAERAASELSAQITGSQPVPSSSGDSQPLSELKDEDSVEDDQPAMLLPPIPVGFGSVPDPSIPLAVRPRRADQAEGWQSVLEESEQWQAFLVQYMEPDDIRLSDFDDCVAWAWRYERFRATGTWPVRPPSRTAQALMACRLAKSALDALLPSLPEGPTHEPSEEEAVHEFEEEEDAPVAVQVVPVDAAAAPVDDAAAPADDAAAPVDAAAAPVDHGSEDDDDAEVVGTVTPKEPSDSAPAVVDGAPVGQGTTEEASGAIAEASDEDEDEDASPPPSQGGADPPVDVVDVAADSDGSDVDLTDVAARSDGPSSRHGLGITDGAVRRPLTRTPHAAPPRPPPRPPSTGRILLKHAEESLSAIAEGSTEDDHPLTADHVDVPMTIESKDDGSASRDGDEDDAKPPQALPSATKARTKKLVIVTDPVVLNPDTSVDRHVSAGLTAPAALVTADPDKVPFSVGGQSDPEFPAGDADGSAVSAMLRQHEPPLEADMSKVGQSLALLEARKLFSVARRKANSAMEYDPEADDARARAAAERGMFSRKSVVLPKGRKSMRNMTAASPSEGGLATTFEDAMEMKQMKTRRSSRAMIKQKLQKTGSFRQSHSSGSAVSPAGIPRNAFSPATESRQSRARIVLPSSGVDGDLTAHLGMPADSSTSDSSAQSPPPSARSPVPQAAAAEEEVESEPILESSTPWMKALEAMVAYFAESVPITPPQAAIGSRGDVRVLLQEFDGAEKVFTDRENATRRGIGLSVPAIVAHVGLTLVFARSMLAYRFTTSGGKTALMVEPSSTDPSEGFTGAVTMASLVMTGALFWLLGLAWCLRCVRPSRVFELFVQPEALAQWSWFTRGYHPMFAAWEVWVVLRALVLALIVALIEDELTRGVIMFVLLAGMLCVHIVVLPYSWTWANVAEGMSLLTLMLIGGSMWAAAVDPNWLKSPGADTRAELASMVFSLASLFAFWLTGLVILLRECMRDCGCVGGGAEAEEAEVYQIKDQLDAELKAGTAAPPKDPLLTADVRRRFHVDSDPCCGHPVSCWRVVCCGPLQVSQRSTTVLAQTARAELAALRRAHLSGASTFPMRPSVLKSLLPARLRVYQAALASSEDEYRQLIPVLRTRTLEECGIAPRSGLDHWMAWGFGLLWCGTRSSNSDRWYARSGGTETPEVLDYKVKVAAMAVEEGLFSSTYERIRSELGGGGSAASRSRGCCDNDPWCQLQRKGCAMSCESRSIWLLRWCWCDCCTRCCGTGAYEFPELKGQRPWRLHNFDAGEQLWLSQVVRHEIVMDQARRVSSVMARDIRCKSLPQPDPEVVLARLLRESSRTMMEVAQAVVFAKDKVFKEKRARRLAEEAAKREQAKLREMKARELDQMRQEARLSEAKRAEMEAKRAEAEAELKRQEEAIARQAMDDAQKESARAEQVEAADRALRRRMARMQEDLLLKRQARDEQLGESDWHLGMPADAVTELIFSQLNSDGAINEHAVSFSTSPAADDEE
jgi:hypothetical protein